MILKKADYKILNDFHKSFFRPRFFVEGIKPNIDRFIIQKKISENKIRWRKILSLYTFNFWCLSYTLEAPSNEFIRESFKHYK